MQTRPREPLEYVLEYSSNFLPLHNAASKVVMHCGTPSLCYICCRLFVHWDISAKILALAVSTELIEYQPTTLFSAANVHSFEF